MRDNIYSVRILIDTAKVDSDNLPEEILEYVSKGKMIFFDNYISIETSKGYRQAKEHQYISKDSNDDFIIYNKEENI